MCGAFAIDDSYCEVNAQRALNGRPASAFCNPLQRLSKESAGSVGTMLTVAEAVSCCGDIGGAATVCCISGTLGNSFAYGSLGVALATV